MNELHVRLNILRLTYADYEGKKIPEEYWKEAGHGQQRKNWGTHESRQQEQGAYQKDCAVKETTSNALVSKCDGIGYDWSD
ncbi:hypothetical protein Tco_1551760 [Tanacetum coccineum]